LLSLALAIILGLGFGALDLGPIHERLRRVSLVSRLARAMSSANDLRRRT